MSDITLGIIGSGQLGSLLCQAAKKLNIKTVVISDDEKVKSNLNKWRRLQTKSMKKKPK